MHFSKSSEECSIGNDGVLHAKCQARNQSWRTSSLDLNTLLGNIDGHFAPGLEDFAQTARDLALCRSEGGLYLKATLQRRDWQQWHLDYINLDVLIDNVDGDLHADHHLILAAAEDVLGELELPQEDMQQGLQAMVSALRSDAIHTQKKIKGDLRTYSEAAHQSNYMTRQAILQLERKLIGASDRNVRETMRVHKRHLLVALADMTAGWAKVQKVASRAQEELVEFRDIRVNGDMRRIQTTKRVLDTGFDRAKLGREQLSTRVQEIRRRITQKEETVRSAQNQAENAGRRQKSFFWAAMALPIVFAPLHVGLIYRSKATSENATWISTSEKLQDELNRAHGQKDVYLIAIRLLELFALSADSKLELNVTLQRDVSRTANELVTFEHELQEFQEKLAVYTQRLDTLEVTLSAGLQLEYRKILSQGLQLLDGADHLELGAPTRQDPS